MLLWVGVGSGWCAEEMLWQNIPVDGHRNTVYCIVVSASLEDMAKNAINNKNLIVMRKIFLSMMAIAIAMNAFAYD